MAERPCMPLWTDAYLGDTIHLSTVEHGAYLLLLMAMWRSGGTLPNDGKKLARFCRMTPRQWDRVSDTIFEFFEVEGDTIFQPRLKKELDAVRQKSKSQSAKAKAKWLKERETNDAAASSGQSQTDASPSPSPSQVKEEPNGSSKTSGELDLQEAPKPETKSRPKRDGGFDPSLSIPDEVAKQWIVHRRAIKAPMSPGAYPGINRELRKIADAGHSPVEALQEAMAAGWRGVKADWVINRLSGQRSMNGSQGPPVSTEDRLAQARATEERLRQQGHLR